MNGLHAGALFALGLALLAGAGCSHKPSEAELAAMEKAKADSIAEVRLQMQRDSLRRDSIWQAEMMADYNKGLTVTLGKQNYTFFPYREGAVITQPLTITNNTGATLLPDDYVIDYILEFATCSDGTLPNDVMPDEMKGPTLDPGKSVSLVIKKDCDVIRGVKAHIKLTPEEFIERMRAMKNNK